MNNFAQRNAELRKDIINYIREYLLKVNRSIIVEKGNLTYMQWDCATPSDKQDEKEVVPEVEIMMITLDSDKEVVFYDAKGYDVYPSSLDTEELTYVVDYFDYLDEKESGVDDIEIPE
jgi:hypothetical protein